MNISKDLIDAYIKNRNKFLIDCIEAEIKDSCEIVIDDEYKILLFANLDYITVYKVKNNEIYMMYNLKKEEFVSKEFIERFLDKKEVLPGNLKKLCNNKDDLIDRFVYFLREDLISFKYDHESSLIIGAMVCRGNVVELKMNKDGILIDLI